MRKNWRGHNNIVRGKGNKRGSRGCTKDYKRNKSNHRKKKEVATKKRRKQDEIITLSLEITFSTLEIVVPLCISTKEEAIIIMAIKRLLVMDETEQAVLTYDARTVVIYLLFVKLGST